MDAKKRLEYEVNNHNNKSAIEFCKLNPSREYAAIICANCADGYLDIQQGTDRQDDLFWDADRNLRLAVALYKELTYGK